MQIRDGVHVFGGAPEGEQLTDLLVALARLPRGAAPEQASLIRALAGDLDLDFDPLDCDLGAKWTGKRPAILSSGKLPPPLRGRDGVGGSDLAASGPFAKRRAPPSQPSRARGEGYEGALPTNGD